MIAALGILSGVVSAVQLATDRKREQLSELLTLERPLARRQYQAIMRARELRKAGDVRGFERCRALAVEMDARRAPLVRQIRAAHLQWSALDTELNNATVRLDEPAPEET